MDKKHTHVALVKPTLLEKLKKEGRLTRSKTVVEMPVREEVIPPKSSMATAAAHGAASQDKTKARTRLRILHDKAPTPTGDKTPPCDSCVTAVCCYAFLIYLTEDEYKSGLYGDYVVKLTPEVRRQLNNRASMQTLAGMSHLTRIIDNKDAFYLEGTISEPCPFLKDSKCSIYEHRPYVCRVYSCVGDIRITEEMRKHTGSEEDLKTLIWENMITNATTKL